MNNRAQSIPGGKRSPLPDWDRLDFAFRETDTLYRCEGDIEREPVWTSGKTLPFGELPVHPASAFLSYGLGIFEGLKAHRARDGRILLFRHGDNAVRFQRSAEKLMMPAFPKRSFVDAVEAVVRGNERFVPPYGKGSFYVRPLQHATEPKVGIAPCSQFWVLIFGLPVGEYFAAGDGVRLKVLDQGRVAPGGTGAAKAMGNYAGGIAIAHPWKQQGFDDVLYLDARHVRYVTETSGSNVFARLSGGEIVTPPLDDQILPGITRDTVIRLAREVLEMEVVERPLPLEQVLDEATEIFCTGTAWTVQHVRELDYCDRVHKFETRQLQQALLEELRGIQLGEREDRFDWVTEVT